MPIAHDRILLKIFRFLLFLLIFLPVVSSHASDIIFIGNHNDQGDNKLFLTIKDASDYLGVTVEWPRAETCNNYRSIECEIVSSRISVAIITQSLLPNQDTADSKAIFRRLQKRLSSLMIARISPAGDNDVLQLASGNTIFASEFNRSIKKTPKSEILVFQGKRVGPLSGCSIPVLSDAAIRLVPGISRNLEMILGISTEGRTTPPSLFMGFTRIGNLDLFALVDSRLKPTLPPKGRQELFVQRFIELAPFLLFIKSSLPERVWCAPRKLANFTIDDPWLIEPYGHLNYHRLLREMDSAGFHTTIAFVPWNYERNQEDVISIFKQRSDRFSLCIHGNNHDHREFGMKGDESNSEKSVRLAREEFNIQQAIARMESMRKRIGISYDRVMVFPHGIASRETLGLLQKYNLLSTFNVYNQPLGHDRSSSTSDILRAWIPTAGSFPSIRRHPPIEDISANLADQEGPFSVGWTDPRIVAIELFLENPLIFYSHQDYFENGIGRFNHTANFVNKLAPEIRWSSLGEISRYLYIQRMRADGDYDIAALSPDITLNNTDNSLHRYHIIKIHDDSTGIYRMTVDNVNYPFCITKGCIELIVEILPHQQRQVRLEFANDFVTDVFPTSRQGIRIAILRYASDFRDLVVSRNLVGAFFIRLIYKPSHFKLSIALIISALSIIVIVVFLTIIKHKAKAYEAK
ncbi:MAG TPA: hypothetical protein VGK27_11835 [Candidatus Deferrimicrobiaceae bacterium]|jgi:hypothetical protein